MIHKLIFTILIIFVLIIGFFTWMNFTGVGHEAKNMAWGVTFSASHAEYLKLPWQKAYTSILDDLEVKRFRLIAEWDVVEPSKGNFDFSIIDWQLEELKKRQGNAIVTLGIKVPHWPECHVPTWAKNLSKNEQQDAIISYIEKSVRHLVSANAISAWQIENEPFLSFGECPWHIDEDFLRREIASLKAIDSSRPVIVTGSGEWATLFREARLGDVVGTTLYRRVFFGPFGIFIGYPFSSASYSRKAWLVKKLFGKDVINVELQAEPWSESGLLAATKEDDDKTFSLENFRENIEFAKRAGHREAYLWGAEWWLYKKESGHPEYWDEARKIFQRN